MSSFQFGKFIYDSQSSTSLLNTTKFIYGNKGAIQGGLFAAGVTAAAAEPLIAIASPIVTAAAALYGVKQVYDGIKSWF